MTGPRTPRERRPSSEPATHPLPVRVVFSAEFAAEIFLLRGDGAPVEQCDPDGDKKECPHRRPQQSERDVEQDQADIQGIATESKRSPTEDDPGGATRQQGGAV